MPISKPNFSALLLAPRIDSRAPKLRKNAAGERELALEFHVASLSYDAEKALLKAISPVLKPYGFTMVERNGFYIEFATRDKASIDHFGALLSQARVDVYQEDQQRFSLPTAPAESPLPADVPKTLDELLAKLNVAAEEYMERTPAKPSASRG
jgi:hypothetical protein